MSEGRTTETIGAVGSIVGWTTFALGALQVTALVLTIIVTGITLYMVWPRFWARFKRDGFFPKDSE